MNEQEKALQGIIEFCQWLIPNAKQLGLEQSKSIAMISQAQTPDDIVKGMNNLYQELGEEQFTALTQTFKKNKSQAIPMNKKGAKIDYLINKFASGGPVTYVKYDDRGRRISFDEQEKRDRLVNNAKDLREETINDDGHFIHDRIDFGPIRMYRDIHNWNLSPADTTYFYDFGNGHRISIESGRGMHFSSDGKYNPINKNMSKLLQDFANKNIHR